jgi:hypothetical protein
MSRKDLGIYPKGSPTEMMMKWFDYDDPIAIAKDPECEYFGLLASHIKRESDQTKHALAARSRLAFIEMRIAMEFGDCLLSQRDDS